LKSAARVRGTAIIHNVEDGEGRLGGVVEAVPGVGENVTFFFAACVKMVIDNGYVSFRAVNEDK
jgi:hypothetical protein